MHIVDFWFDPSCPLSVHTARWLVEVSRVRPVELRWHVMSLSVLNEHRDDDPENDPEGYLWYPVRVAAAVQELHGSAALGRFYAALWEGRGGQDEHDWIGDVETALRAAGAPAELAGVAATSEYDAALRASHASGIGLVDGEVGTPIVAVTGPDGRRIAFFGPVLAAAPSPPDVLRLWDGTLLLAAVPGFRELKASP